MGRILIADDHDALRRGLARALTAANHEVEEAPNGNQAIERLHDGHFDVVLSDLKMGGSDGLDVLRTTKTLHPSTAVILMTAFGSVHTAVEAMKSGAFDYVQKPFEIEEMEVKIEKALEMRRMRHELDYLRHTQNDIYDFDRIVGQSDPLKRVLGVVKKVAKSNTTVLIRGETGTGKELIAGAIHHNSLRASRNFVKVNCAALPETLLESELFGHEKGAFTGADRQRIGRFEQADGGSLFLDEVGDMSAAIQAKILRVLQEHEFERLGGTRTQKVDVRLVAATNRDLSAMVASGAFREDLYYRLNVVSVEMPPLRERKEDIIPLAMFFVKKFAGELKKKIDGIDPEAQKMLLRYNWPGNIRELENSVERAILMTEGQFITSEDLRLGEAATAGVTSTREASALVKIPPSGVPLEEIERSALMEALKMSNWVQKDAAELLGISPRVMNYKIKTLRHRVSRAGADRWSPQQASRWAQVDSRQAKVQSQVPGRRLKSAVALFFLPIGSENFQKHAFGFVRRIRAELVAQQFAALAEDAQRFGAVAHLRMRLHQMPVSGFLERLALDNFRRVLNGQSRFPVRGTDLRQNMQAAHQQRAQLHAASFDPDGFFTGEERASPNAHQRRGMAPGTRRLPVSQGAIRFVDGVGGVLEIDPDVGGQTHLHRP